MSRPRTASDEEILEATARAISRVGPAKLTLADVAGEVGLAPSTLVQRFGSKRGLLLAFAEQGSADVERTFAAARRTHRSPLRALLRALAATTRFFDTPEALSNHLALFQMDLSDPDFHRPALAHARAVRREIRKLLGEAAAAGELRRSDVPGLARAVQSMMNGSMLTWALYRRGRLDRWLRGDLETLLRPLRR